MPISSPIALNSFISRFFYEGIVGQGNPIRTVVTSPQFPFNTVWEQNPPQPSDFLIFRNINLLPGFYTFKAIVIDSNVGTDEISFDFRPPNASVIDFISLGTIIMSNPALAVAIEFERNNIEINSAGGEIIMSSNFGATGFTAGSYLSLSREPE